MTSADTPSDKKSTTKSLTSLFCLYWQPVPSSATTRSFTVTPAHAMPWPASGQQAKISLVNSRGRKHDVPLISLPKSVWILIPHICKDLQGGFSLHWLYLCCRKEHFPHFFTSIWNATVIQNVGRGWKLQKHNFLWTKSALGRDGQVWWRMLPQTNLTYNTCTWINI